MIHLLERYRGNINVSIDGFAVALRAAKGLCHRLKKVSAR